MIVQDSFSEGTLDQECGSGREDCNELRLLSDSEPVASRPKLLRLMHSSSTASDLHGLYKSDRVDVSVQTSRDPKDEQTKQSLEEQLCTLQEKYKAQFTFYENERRKMGAQIRELQRQLDVFDSVSKAVGKRLSLEKLLISSRNRTKTLEDTLAAERQLHAFSSFAVTEKKFCNKGFIGPLMESMGIETNRLACLDNIEISDISVITKRSDWLKLVLRAFPGAEPLTEYTNLEIIIQQRLRLNDLIRTLVAAALCCWVFDPPLGFLCANSPCQLLYRYRQCLETQGMLTKSDLRTY